MAIESDNQLKTYFNTGDVPTEENYHNFIESKYSRFHGLGSNEITVQDDYQIQIPAKQMLIRVVVWATSAATINLGDALGEKQYIDEEPLVANQPRIFDINPAFSLNAKSVFLQFDGSQGTTAGQLIYYIQ